MDSKIDHPSLLSLLFGFDLNLGAPPHHHRTWCRPRAERTRREAGGKYYSSFLFSFETGFLFFFSVWYIFFPFPLLPLEFEIDEGGRSSSDVIR
ncbi:hypothetical protein ES288_A09G116200v1 [Gossypium darwinii]|uniref:Uncharacterized protein n=1 Tax=Gossypium darwinii TaxID=34276 RepID=A0A5D2F7W7_GOSDA|nr:hypothetical protein ES288_A09G116200v1 [Gossypium darwinii]